ncbi:hypothetical protein SeMB42_g00626 [Synchytrium endobioticum]|uniref:Secreted protein n=1 Tax=Synchytrium endobioticum TaxID=286115 RepID=A0A507DPZ2_9FUNG|nr:hypothetical protein SeMB42_g00626 [Synchytrium endobioticum]
MSAYASRVRLIAALSSALVQNVVWISLIGCCAGLPEAAVQGQEHPHEAEDKRLARRLETSRISDLRVCSTLCCSSSGSDATDSTPAQC